MNLKHITIHSMLKHLAEEASPPSGIDLWPAIQGRLIASKPFSQYKEPSMNTNNTKKRQIRLVAASLLILLVLATIFFFTPQGQAWAQTVLRFFKHSGNEQILSTPAPVNMVDMTPGVVQPTLTPEARQYPVFFETCGDFLTPRCSLEQIKGLVDFPVKGIAAIPEGMIFVGATGGSDGVILLYQRDEPMTTLLLQQWPVSRMDMPLSVADNAEIEIVQIRGTQGEYVKGAWSHYAGDEVALWDPNLDIQSLRWEADDMLFTIEVIGSTDFPSNPLDKKAMALLAMSLTDQIDVPFTQPTPESPKSLAEVEQQVGFQAIEPTWLPQEYQLDRIDFVPERNMICLEYRHPADDSEPSLSVAESVDTPLPDLDELFPTLPDYGQYLEKENITVGGAFNESGVFAYGNMDASQVCGNRLQSKMLQVRMKGLNFSIYARASGLLSTRNWLTRQEMVQLAESITGVKTIAESQIDPEFLTSVAEAEKLTGFHLKLPTQLPEGKTFNHIRIEVVGSKRTAVISYSDSNNVFEVSQTIGSDNTLETITKDHPEAYDQIAVHSQPALISQGYWDSDGWKKIEAGGDGGITLTWFEEGIQYMVSGFNEYPRSVWLAIAESLE